MFVWNNENKTRHQPKRHTMSPSLEGSSSCSCLPPIPIDLMWLFFFRKFGGSSVLLIRSHSLRCRKGSRLLSVMPPFVSFSRGWFLHVFTRVFSQFRWLAGELARCLNCVYRGLFWCVDGVSSFVLLCVSSCTLFVNVPPIPSW